MYLENHTTHKDETCTVMLVRILCHAHNDYVCGVRAHGLDSELVKLFHHSRIRENLKI